nr:hypothetical protein [uncultured Desulfuromonas sp.]
MNKHTISYSWGDPREPEWHNGVRIFSILYQDNQRRLSFKVLPNKTGEKNTEWMVIPPKNIRISFKGDNAYLDACDLVVDYLKTNDFSADYTLKAVEFLSVTLDFSDVPGWFSTQLSLFKEKYSRQLMYVPKFSTLLVFLVGLSVIFLHQHNSEGMFYSHYVRSLLFSLGTIVLLMLILQIKKGYRNMQFILRFHATNLKREAIKLLVRLYLVRYLVTLNLGIGLIYYAQTYV